MRLHPRNKPFLDLPDAHPAKRYLLAQAQFRSECIGLEIEWPNSNAKPVEQKWNSQIKGKPWSLSAILYSYISFTPELDAWITNPPQVTEIEKKYLQGIAECRALLEECEVAAQCDNNNDALNIIQRAREVLDLWQLCIDERIKDL